MADIDSPPLIDREVPLAPPPRRGWRQWLFGATLVFIAFNLRPLFTSFGSLLKTVQADTGLSGLGVSSMTTLPVFCLGLFAPVAPRLARRFGTERLLLGLVLLLALGTALRGLGTIPALVGGTLLAGIAIANANVLLPGLVKRDFPHRTGLMAGLYVMAMCAGAALAAGATVPLSALLGGAWNLALAVWALPALAAGLLWAAQLPRGGGQGGRTAAVRGHWRSPLAWQVTGFMALQSMLSFTVFGWLSPILQERGLDAVAAGRMVSVSVLFQTAACLVAPPLAARLRRQSWLDVATVALAVTGLLGCLYAPPSLLWPAAILQGCGQGALTSVALTLIVLRARDSHVAAELSGMVQGVGYAIGATGPLLVGVLHQASGSFSGTGLLFAGIGILAGIVGHRAGRAEYVAAAPVQAEHTPR